MTPRRLAVWIETASWAFVALGILLPVAFHTAPFSMYRDALSSWAFGTTAVPPADARLLGLMLGITGASIAGKWLVHARIARGPLAEGRAWARDATMAGLLLWFVVDSSASFALGASFNVWMINLLPLVVVGVPLLLSWRSFPPRAGAARPALSVAAVAARWTSLAGCASGLLIAFGGSTAIWAPWFHGLEAAQYGGTPLAEPARRLALFFFGPIGGCTLAQFGMLAVFVRNDGATARAATAGIVSIAAWFLVDSAWGVVHDGLFNIAVVNVPAVAVTLPAWLAMEVSRRRG